MDTRGTTSAWRDCNFREIDGIILYCSATELYYPHGAFLSWVPQVNNVKSRFTQNRYQEYLINDEKVFLIKGGSNWEIKYVSTLEELKKDEMLFGMIMLERAKKSKMPWHLVKITKNIASDFEALEILAEIKKIAKGVTQKQTFALRSLDLELRLKTLEIVLGEKIWNRLKDVLIDNEKLSRFLAYYLAFKGEVEKKDLDKQCHIPNPIFIGYLEEYVHNIRMRALQVDVPQPILELTIGIDSNDEAIEVLNEIKNTATNGYLYATEALSIKSPDAKKRNEALEKIFRGKVWDSIKEQVLNNDNLSYFLAYYLRCKGRIH